MFSVRNLQNETSRDQQLSELLFDVYVGGGFSDRNWATTAFRAEELRRRGEIFVAEGDGGLLGTVVLNRPEDEFRQIANDQEAEIHLLAVKPAARRWGAATVLIRACEQRALDLGFDEIVLSTQPRMLPAQALYRRLGYNRNPNRDWSNKSGKSYMAFEKKLSAKLHISQEQASTN